MPYSQLPSSSFSYLPPIIFLLSPSSYPSSIFFTSFSCHPPPNTLFQPFFHPLASSSYHSPSILPHPLPLSSHPPPITDLPPLFYHPSHILIPFSHTLFSLSSNLPSILFLPPSSHHSPVKTFCHHHPSSTLLPVPSFPHSVMGTSCISWPRAKLPSPCLGSWVLGSGITRWVSAVWQIGCGTSQRQHGWK